MIENAIYHNGLVALRYYQPVPKYVSLGGKEFVCDVRRGVSILLAEEQYVPSLLEVVGGCCGGKKKVFSLCGREAFNIWLTGER